MSAKVLEFQKYSSSSPEDSFSYIVMEAHFPKQSYEAFFLSPDLMKWEDNLWIINLEPSKKYWQALAQKKGSSLLSVLEDKVSLQAQYVKTWVLCKHPWQGLVILPKLRPSLKAYTSSSPYACKLLKSLSWEEYLQPEPSLQQKLHELKVPTSYSIEKLLKAMRLLGLEGPFDSSSLSDVAFQKRYGSWLNKIRHWGFVDLDSSHAKNSPPELLDLDPSNLNSFPWVPYRIKEKIQISRSLDYGLESWQQIQEFLLEDFSYLQKKLIFCSDLKISKIYWRIYFFSGESTELCISLRSPYNIHTELPHFESLMLQSSFLFQQWQIKNQPDPQYNDYPENTKILSWQLELGAFSYLKTEQLSFSSSGSSQACPLKILDLENKLPRAIEQYSLSCTHEVLNNYQQQSISLATNSAPPSSNLRFHNLRFAKLRPLYVYPKAIPAYTTSSGTQQFSERGSSSWWQGSSISSYLRDFFHQIHQHRKKWLYRENQALYEIASFD